MIPKTTRTSAPRGPEPGPAWLWSNDVGWSGHSGHGFAPRARPLPVCAPHLIRIPASLKRTTCSGTRHHPSWVMTPSFPVGNRGVSNGRGGRSGPAHSRGVRHGRRPALRRGHHRDWRRRWDARPPVRQQRRERRPAAGPRRRTRSRRRGRCGRGDPPSINEKNNVEGLKRLRKNFHNMLSKLGCTHHPLQRSLYCTRACRRRDRIPGGHRPLRPRSGQQRSRRELQGARRGQPVRGGHQLLPEHRGRDPSLTAIANARGSAITSPNAMAAIRAAMAAVDRAGKAVT